MADQLPTLMQYLHKRVEESQPLMADTRHHMEWLVGMFDNILAEDPPQITEDGEGSAILEFKDGSACKLGKMKLNEMAGGQDYAPPIAPVPRGGSGRGMAVDNSSIDI